MDTQQLSSTLPRLAPATIHGQRVYVPCEAWCTIDHVDQGAGAIEDIWHSSDTADLSAPRMDFPAEMMAYAKIQQDSFAPDPRKRVPFISVEDASSVGYDMTPDQADQFADNLEAFAEKIRALARIARDAA